MTPARILAKLRKQSGLTAQQLAQAVNLTRQAIHAIETGKRQPSLKTARALVKAMGQSLAVFD